MTVFLFNKGHWIYKRSHSPNFGTSRLSFFIFLKFLSQQLPCKSKQMTLLSNIVQKISTNFISVIEIFYKSTRPDFIFWKRYSILKKTITQLKNSRQLGNNCKIKRKNVRYSFNYLNIKAEVQWVECVLND